MESWRICFRKGLLPLLSRRHLEVLAQALREDDPRLVQEATTVPKPLPCTSDWPVEAACLIGFCGWQGEGLETVKEVEEFFARMCFEIDQRLGEPAGCRHLVNHYDETERKTVFRELLGEVELALGLRKEGDELTAALGSA